MRSCTHLGLRPRLQLFDRNLFWYAAIFGTILAVSRSLITEEYTVFDPEAVMQYTARYTHYMPKHWRGKANTDSVRAEFEALFQVSFL
jgi:autophagy-related protein 9